MNQDLVGFISLTKEYEALKEQLEKVSEDLQASLANLTPGTYVQDPETLLVYKVVKPSGTFTKFKDKDYVRTAKPDEHKGSLSKKEAQEQGFILNNS